MTFWIDQEEEYRMIHQVIAFVIVIATGFCGSKVNSVFTSNRLDLLFTTGQPNER
jgi:hypothetical protein